MYLMYVDGKFYVPVIASCLEMAVRPGGQIHSDFHDVIDIAAESFGGQVC